MNHPTNEKFAKRVAEATARGEKPNILDQLNMGINWGFLEKSYNDLYKNDKELKKIFKHE